MLISATPAFPRPEAPFKAAWYLAIALIGQADLDQPEPTCVLSLETIFQQAESISKQWLDETMNRALGFGLVAYDAQPFEESDFDSMCLFITLSYRKDPSRIEAELHPRALAYLKQLQVMIHHLQLQNKLTPLRLNRRMKSTAPLTVLNMKKDLRYKELVMPLYKYKEIDVEGSAIV
jgi:hypothetical protein